MGFTCLGRYLDLTSYHIDVRILILDVLQFKHMTRTKLQGTQSQGGISQEG
jgi:hypothetical protein